MVLEASPRLAKLGGEFRSLQQFDAVDFGSPTVEILWKTSLVLVRLDAEQEIRCLS